MVDYPLNMTKERSFASSHKRLESHEQQMHPAMLPQLLQLLNNNACNRLSLNVSSVGACAHILL